MPVCLKQYLPRIVIPPPYPCHRHRFRPPLRRFCCPPHLWPPFDPTPLLPLSLSLFLSAFMYLVVARYLSSLGPLIAYVLVVVQSPSFSGIRWCSLLGCIRPRWLSLLGCILLNWSPSSGVGLHSPVVVHNHWIGIWGLVSLGRRGQPCREGDERMDDESEPRQTPWFAFVTHFMGLPLYGSPRCFSILNLSVERT